MPPARGARGRYSGDDRVTSARSDIVLSPNVLSLRHWQRVLGGLLYASSPRVDWATLLRRSFSVDVLQCPSCGGRLRVHGEITEPTYSLLATTFAEGCIGETVAALEATEALEDLGIAIPRSRPCSRQSLPTKHDTRSSRGVRSHGW